MGSTFSVVMQVALFSINLKNLFKSTQNKWIVHGVIQGRLWKVNGLENLLEQGDIKMNQMLRITAQGPVTPIVLLAYMVRRTPLRKIYYP